MTWIKSNPTPLCGGNYLIDKEFCLYFRKGVKLNTTYETASTYWMSPKNKDDKNLFNHPTIKPLNIIKTLIKNSSKENDIVADFFGGVATTAVACKDLNRRFILIEKEMQYCKIGEQRLNKCDNKGQFSFFLR